MTAQLFTAGEREDALRARTAPDGRTWLSIAMEAVRLEGAAMEDVLAIETAPAASRARRRAWVMLAVLGYTPGEIGRGWGMDRSSVAGAFGSHPPPVEVRLRVPVNTASATIAAGEVLTVRSIVRGKLNLVQGDVELLDIPPAHVALAALPAPVSSAVDGEQASPRAAVGAALFDRSRARCTPNLPRGCGTPIGAQPCRQP